jgi:hypothetical protein
MELGGDLSPDEASSLGVVGHEQLSFALLAPTATLCREIARKQDDLQLRAKSDGNYVAAHIVRLNEHLEHPEGAVVFQHACKTGLEGIVSKRLGSRYRSGRSPDWLKFKNPEAPAVRREAEEDWGK